MHKTGVNMKYIKGEKFAEITAFGNYEGLGQDKFQALERGEEIDNPPKDLTKGGKIKKKESK
jgi:hypothetical protein